MLGRRRRRRANIKTTMGPCLVFAGILYSDNTVTLNKRWGKPQAQNPHRMLVNASLMLGDRLRRWPNSKLKSGQSLVSSQYIPSLRGAHKLVCTEKLRRKHRIYMYVLCGTFYTVNTCQYNTLA